jgi:integrase
MGEGDTRRHGHGSQHGTSRKRMVAEGNDAGPVFCDRKGSWLRKSNVRRRSFEKILERVNDAIEEEAAQANAIPALLPGIRFHDLRHYGQPTLTGERQPEDVSERLGHSKVAVTLDIYSHLLSTMQDGAASQFESLLHRKPENGYSRCVVVSPLPPARFELATYGL